MRQVDNSITLDDVYSVMDFSWAVGNLRASLHALGEIGDELSDDIVRTWIRGGEDITQLDSVSLKEYGRAVARDGNEVVIRRGMHDIEKQAIRNADPSLLTRYSFGNPRSVTSADGTNLHLIFETLE